MPRKYAGPLQPGKKSAYAPGNRKNKKKSKDVNKKPKLNYRSLNTYSFVRETMPETTSFTIIPNGTDHAAMGYLMFSTLKFADLVNAATEFGSIFARYKVSMIKTILTPLFTENPSGFSPYSPSLRITRINTKWLNVPFIVGANADMQLAQLAQFQTKSVKPYASRRSLIITTRWPGVSEQAVVDNLSAEIETRKPMPWLNITSQSNVPLKHNSIIFAERTDGQALDANWKYRVVHKIYFRCAQVG